MGCLFCKNRDRLLGGDVAAKFMAGILNLPDVCKLLSSEHFSVDGTLIEAWASMKSFVPKDGSNEPPKDGGRNSERDFHGEKRANETHASTTDPDARLFRKGVGKEAKLCHMGHIMIENSHGLIVDARLTEANGTSEEPFGWMKTVGVMRKTRHRGRELVEWFFVLTAAAYNLIRIPKLFAAVWGR